MRLFEIENAVVNAIKQTGVFATVKGYQGEFSRVNALKMPSAFVVYEKGEYKELNSITERVSRWSVIIATTSVKREKAREEIYELLDTVRGAVKNLSVCSNCGHFELKEESLLEINEIMMAFTQTYQLKERFKED